VWSAQIALSVVVPAVVVLAVEVDAEVEVGAERAVFAVAVPWEQALGIEERDNQQQTEDAREKDQRALAVTVGS